MCDDNYVWQRFVRVSMKSNSGSCDEKHWAPNRGSETFETHCTHREKHTFSLLTNEFICCPTISSIKWAASEFCFLDPSPKPCLDVLCRWRGYQMRMRPAAASVQKNKRGINENRVHRENEWRKREVSVKYRIRKNRTSEWEREKLRA